MSTSVSVTCGMHACVYRNSCLGHRNIAITGVLGFPLEPKADLLLFLKVSGQTSPGHAFPEKADFPGLKGFSLRPVSPASSQSQVFPCG